MKLHSFLLAIGLCIVVPATRLQSQAGPEVQPDRPELSLQEKQAAQRAAFRQAEKEQTAGLEEAQAKQRQAQATQALLNKLTIYTPVSEEEAALAKRIKEITEKSTAKNILANKSMPTAENRAVWIDAFVSTYEGPFTGSSATQPEKNAWISALNTLFENLDIEKLKQVAASDAVETAYNNLSPRLKIALAERIETTLKPTMKQLESTLGALNLNIIEEERKLGKAQKKGNPISIQTAQENLAILRNESSKVAKKIADSALVAGVSSVGIAAMQGTRTYAGQGLETGLALIPQPVKNVIGGTISAADSALQTGKEYMKWVRSGQASEAAKEKVMKTLSQAAKTTQKAIDWTSEKAATAYKATAEKVASAVETGKEYAQRAKEKAEAAYTAGAGAVTSVVETGKGYAQLAKEKAGEAYAAGAGAVTSAVETGKEYAQLAKEKVGEAYTASAEALARMREVFEPGEGEPKPEPALAAREVFEAGKPEPEPALVVAPGAEFTTITTLKTLQKNKKIFEDLLEQAKRKANNEKEIKRLSDILDGFNLDIALLKQEEEQQTTEALLEKAKKGENKQDIAKFEGELAAIKGRIALIQEKKDSKKAS